MLIGEGLWSGGGELDHRLVKWGLECEIGGCMASLLWRWLFGLAMGTLGS